MKETLQCNVEFYYDAELDNLLYALSKDGIIICAASMPGCLKTGFKKDVETIFGHFFTKTLDKLDTRVTVYGLKQTRDIFDAYIKKQIRPQIVSLALIEDDKILVHNIEPMYDAWENYVNPNVQEI